MATITLGDDSFVYEDRGAGPPVVLIHGHPFNRTMWNEQLEAFSGAHRVVAPDLRGYGESQSAVHEGVRGAGARTLLDDFARDIEGLIAHLGIEPCVLAGLSMGGQIALEFYRQFPDRVRALILADTFAQLDTDEGRQARIEAAARLLREGMSGYSEEVLPKMMTPANIARLPAAAARDLAMMKGTDPAGAAAAMLGRSERRDYTDLLSRITVPVLIIVGSEDAFTPVADAEYMRDRIRGSKLAVIEGAGHMPNIERADEFNRIVKEFLSEMGA